MRAKNTCLLRYKSQLVMIYFTKVNPIPTSSGFVHTMPVHGWLILLMAETGTELSYFSSLVFAVRLSCMSVLQSTNFGAALCESDAYSEKFCTEKSNFTTLVSYRAYQLSLGCDIMPSFLSRHLCINLYLRNWWILLNATIHTGIPLIRYYLCVCN